MPESEQQVPPDESEEGGQEPKPGKTAKTARDRAAEKRAEKLEVVRQQVESGSLVIRKMTDEERRRYPARPDKPKRSGR